jgi:epoxide hydrolase-like predicted phosphatase
MIKAIIFDFGGVFDQQHEALGGFHEAAQRYGVSPEAFYDLLYSGDAWKQARTGTITGRAYWHQSMVALGHDPADDVDAFKAALFAGRELDAGVVAIARRLARRFPLALLSNATDELEAMLEHEFGIHDLFAVVINSARVGVAKPDPRAYQLALDGLGVAPHEALFIDDKPRNVAASLALGIPAIHFTSAAALEVELEQRGLLDPVDRAP